MSDITWFNRRPGEVASTSVDDETCLLIDGGAVPDWAKMPPDLDQSERALRVLAARVGPCPRCEAETVRHLYLEDDYGVAECASCGFVWYRRKGETA